MSTDEFFEGQLGRTLLERYTLNRVLGIGGYGAVYEASDKVLERTVAIKVLKAQASEKDGAGRFLREAKILARIRHPNVVQVIDCVEESSLLCLVMELVEGAPLSDIIRDHFPLQAARVADICDQILRALEEAHAQGIIHRDLKPENVLVSSQRDGTDLIKVVDFGTAVLREPQDGFKTQEGLLVGTPAYMSPEQCRAFELDGRSDLYAFGCILYELLCGRPPFLADGPFDIMMAHVYHEPVAPSKRLDNIRVSPGLETIAIWCLAKVPADRPGSAAALRHELARAVKQGLDNSSASTGSKTGGPRDGGHRSVGATAPRDVSETSARVLVLTGEVESLSSVIEALRARGDYVEVLEELPSAARLEGFDVAVMAEGEPGSLPWMAFLTGHGVPSMVCGPDDDLEVMARALEAGAYDFIPLPVNPLALKRSIARATRARRRGHVK